MHNFRENYDISHNVIVLSIMAATSGRQPIRKQYPASAKSRATPRLSRFCAPCCHNASQYQPAKSQPVPAGNHNDRYLDDAMRRPSRSDRTDSLRSPHDFHQEANHHAVNDQEEKWNHSQRKPENITSTLLILLFRKMKTKSSIPDDRRNLALTNLPSP